MKYRIAIIVFTCAFFLQPTLLNLFRVFGVAPNLLLCLVITVCFLYEGNYSGLILGVVFGLLTDLCYGQFAGVTAMGYFLTGTCVLISKEILNKENLGAVSIVTCGGTLVYNFIYWLLYYFLGSSYTFLHMLKQLPLYLVCNLIVGSIAYFILIGRVTKHRRDRYYR